VRTRSVVLLLLAAALAGSAAWLAGGHGASDPAAGTGQPLLPGLAARINDVAAISVMTKDDHFTVRREGDGWQLAERGGYAARFESVKKTLLGLSELRTLEAKTTNPELYPRLGVEDPESPDSTSALVTLLDADGQSLGAVIVGDSGGQRDTLYARRASEAQSWLVKGPLLLERRATKWVETEAYKLAASRVRSVLTSHADGETVLVSREAESDPNLQLRDVPEGMQPRTSNIGRIQNTVLDPLNFDDVAEAATHPLPDNEVVTTTFETFDGLKVVVTTAREPVVEPTAEDEPPPAARYWAHLQVSAGPEASEAVQTEARETEERLSRWVFALPEYKAGNLRKRMAEMVAPVQPPKGETPEPAPATEGEAAAPAEPADATGEKPEARPAPLDDQP